ncbi:unnamed protein product [Effrenium voratum]|uniref:Uncharacterized protein n=1 Tax=Effrenium voratum TaxID=2562239 RepID=A0AA36J9B0_9DINO|nr:unnamed protein product [Effrenium voratum]CAJ1433587.1 unnamed protein product [Effrenium voratum]
MHPSPQATFASSCLLQFLFVLESMMSYMKKLRFLTKAKTAKGIGNGRRTSSTDPRKVQNSQLREGQVDIGEIKAAGNVIQRLCMTQQRTMMFCTEVVIKAQPAKSVIKALCRFQATSRHR